MPAIQIPGANRTAQWFADDYPGVTMPGIDKLLLHTTETGSWPGYGGGKSSPTATYRPRTHEWRQHFPLNMSARALRDSSGTAVRENRDKVVQVEIICSSDRAFARKHGYPYVADLDRQALDDIAEFAAFLHREWGLPLVKAPVWLPYPQSYGNSAARMSGPEYDRFRGICGHMHASGNTHGDPGAIDIDYILSAAQRLAGKTTTPPPSEDEMSEADVRAIKDAIAAVDQKVTGALAGLELMRQQLGVQWTEEMRRDAVERAELGQQFAGEVARDSAERGETGVQFQSIHDQLAEMRAQVSALSQKEA